MGGQVVLGTVPTPSPGWITPVTFVLSVWALSLVMACCFGAACYKAWYMPRPSQIERVTSGTRRGVSSIGERPSSSSTPRARVREGVERVSKRNGPYHPFCWRIQWKGQGRSHLQETREEGQLRQQKWQIQLFGKTTKRTGL